MSTPLIVRQRHAAFKAALALHELTVAKATSQLGISQNHLRLVLNGDRRASRALEERIAILTGMPREQLFPMCPQPIPDDE